MKETFALGNPMMTLYISRETNPVIRAVVVAVIIKHKTLTNITKQTNCRDDLSSNHLALMSACFIDVIVPSSHIGAACDEVDV
jgi:hypothetical protein